MAVDNRVEGDAPVQYQPGQGREPEDAHAQGDRHGYPGRAGEVGPREEREGQDEPGHHQQREGRQKGQRGGDREDLFRERINRTTRERTARRTTPDSGALKPRPSLDP